MSSRYKKQPRFGLWTILTAGVVVFAVFAAVLWYAYVEVIGLDGDGPPPLIQAEAGPIKVVPEEPGGMEVPNATSPSVEVLEPSRQPVRPETIRPVEDEPPPPEPEPTPEPPAEEQQTATLEDPPPASEPLAPTEPAAATPEPPSAMPGADAQLPEKLEAPAPIDEPRLPTAAAPEEPSPSPVAEAPVTPGPGVEKLVAAEPEEIPAPLPAPRADVPEQAPEPPAPMTEKQVALPAKPPANVEPARSAPAASPIYRIQLGAFRNEAAAGQAWLTLQRRQGAALAGLRANIVAAETSSGTFFRLQAGPVSSKDAAASLCAQVKSSGNDCFIVGPLP